MSRMRLLLLSVAFAPLVLRAQTPTVLVGVGGELSALQGQDLLVPVFADLRSAGGQKLGSYTVRLSWDTTVLRFGTVEAGTFAEPLWRADSAYSRGVLWLTGISAQGAGGLLDLARVRLYVDTALTSAVTVQVTELSAAGTFTDLLSSVTPVSGTFCPARGRWGDVDGGRSLFGTADSRDALLILSSVVGIQVDPKQVDTTRYDISLGDVDGDGKVNTRDALIILSYTVGIQIPGQRVLLVAGGTCTSQVTPSIVVVPDTVDIVGSARYEIHQDVELHALAKTASGDLVTLTGVNWASADPLVAFVTPDGEVFGVDSGTTTITAGIGPGITVTVPAIVRPRRPVWYVDAPKAKQASIQLGTQKWPFSTPERAFGLVTEGDTVRVAPGIHDYEGLYEPLRAGAVIIGDTLADGTRPVLRTRDYDYDAGFYWESGQRGEIRNLVLRGFWVGAYLYGLRNLIVDNVRIEEPRNIYGYGILAFEPMDTLSVRRSAFIGDSLRYNYYGLGVFDGARLLRVDSSRFEFWNYYPIYAWGVDSTDLVGNQIQFNRWGLRLYGPYEDPTLRVSLRNNRFIDHTYEAVYMSPVLRVWFRDNYFLQRNYYYADAVEIHGAYPIRAGTKVSFAGDSIQMRSWYARGMYLDDVDSVLIDRLWYQLPPDTALGAYNDFYVNTARVTNSRFLNLYYEGFDFRGRKLEVDNSEFRGCLVCGLNATGILAYRYNDSGPAITLGNSQFQSLYRAMYAAGTGDSSGPMTITGNTIDSVAYGFDLAAEGISVTDNVFTKIRERAVWAEPSLSNRPFITAALLRNQVTCSVTSYTVFGLVSYYGPARFEDNAVRNCDYGIYAYNDFNYPLADLTILRDTVIAAATTSYHVGIRPDGRWRTTIGGNRVSAGYYGIDMTVTDTAKAVIDSNVVSGAGEAAIRLYFVKGPVTGRKNNITNNPVDGIVNTGTGSGSRSFRLGRFVGNTRYAVNNGDTLQFDAQQNWWADTAGVNGPAADTIFGNVNTSTYLASDPSDVPALAAPAPVIVAARDATLVAIPATPPPAPILEDAAETQERYMAEKRMALERNELARSEAQTQRAEVLGQLDAARRFWEARQAERERTRPRLPR